MAQANSMIPTLSAKNIRNFLKKVNRVDDDKSCWEWTGCRSPRGYGIFVVNGKKYRANRLAYLIATGADLGELNALHECDNPPCCRPEHLFPGTGQDNVDDRQKKGRTSSGESHYARRHPHLVPRGSKRCNATLVEDQVVEIRRLHDTHEMSLGQIAKKFLKSKGCICHIVARRSWSHI